MGIIKTAVKRPVTVLMCVLVVIVIGYTSFSKIPLDLMPKMNIPIALVQTSYEGAGPYEVENLVTRPLESVLSTVENVKNIYSDSSEGSSIVIIEFSDDTDMDFATLQMREKIDMIKSALPDDTTARWYSSDEYDAYSNDKRYKIRNLKIGDKRYSVKVIFGQYRLPALGGLPASRAFPRSAKGRVKSALT